MSGSAGLLNLRIWLRILICTSLLSCEVGCEAEPAEVNLLAGPNGTAEMLVADAEGKEIEHSEVSFRESLSIQDKTIVVDFHAKWCGPCRMLAPELEKVLKSNPANVVVLKVNVDRQPRLAQYFQVSSIPDVRIIKNGRIVDGFRGFQTADKIMARLQ